MKRSFLTVFACLSLVLILSSCGQILEPVIKEVSSFKLKGNGGSGLNFEVGVQVFNPNKMKISMVSYDLDIFVNGVNLGRANSKEKQSLKGQEQKEIMVNVSTSLMKLLTGGLGMLANSSGNRDLQVRVKGDIQGSAMGVKKKFSLDEELPVTLNL
ncbi:MAG: LEA type 2 family protein [Bacteroidia bacterium]|nr:LEA type 2 family protein [Bacteroidia bacterium]